MYMRKNNYADSYLCQMDSLRNKAYQLRWMMSIANTGWWRALPNVMVVLGGKCMGQSNLDKRSMIFSNVHTKSMTYPT